MGKDVRDLNGPIRKLRDAISHQHRQIVRLEAIGAPADVVAMAREISETMTEVVDELREILREAP